MPFLTHHFLTLQTEVSAFAPVLEGQNLRYCGVGAGYDDVIINGNLDELKVCVGCGANQEHLLDSCAIVRCVLREGGHHHRCRFVSAFNGCLVGVHCDTYRCRG